MISEELLRPRKSDPVDPARMKRMIRLQGALNILLLLALAGFCAWFMAYERMTVHHIETLASGAPVRVIMPLQAVAEGRVLKPTDTVHDPVAVVYGEIDDYANLREILDGLTVLIRKTSVAPNPVTGEFVETILLKPGANEIDVVLKWDDTEQYRYQYVISYIKPQEEQATTISDKQLTL